MTNQLDKNVIDTVDSDFRQGMKDAKLSLEKAGAPGPYSLTITKEEALDVGVKHRQMVSGVRVRVSGSSKPAVAEAS